MKRALALVLVASVLLALACRSERASADDCKHLLDRIVELELSERGFRDPVLVERQRRALRRTLAPELSECQGKRLKAGALDCVRKATSSEQISHGCLH